jgi:hypothetical protein
VRLISLSDVLRRYPRVTKTEIVNAVRMTRHNPATYHSSLKVVPVPISARDMKRKISEMTAKKPSIAVTVAKNLSLFMASDLSG